jgi:hypothetical protein
MYGSSSIVADRHAGCVDERSTMVKPVFDINCGNNSRIRSSKRVVTVHDGICCGCLRKRRWVDRSVPRHPWRGLWRPPQLVPEQSRCSRGSQPGVVTVGNPWTRNSSTGAVPAPSATRTDVTQRREVSSTRGCDIHLRGPSMVDRPGLRAALWSVGVTRAETEYVVPEEPN